MNHREDFPPAFQVGPWLVQPDLNRISGPEGDSQMEPLVLQVLLCLAKQPGEVWSRQALLDEVWKDSVVGEEILTRAISELRRAFGDKARDPRFIETIRNHGYRLIEIPRNVPPQKRPSLPSFVPESTPEPLPASAKTQKKPPGKPLLVATLLVALFALMVVFGVKMISSRGDTKHQATTFVSVVPLTSLPGREGHPALSADGTRVAFVWSGPEDEYTDIYVKQRNSETLLRLTESPGWVAWPTWSPDGQTVAFVQGVDGGGILCLVPSLGGTVRRLHSISSWVEGLDYSPDGKSLAFAARGDESGKFGIYLLNLQDLQVQKLSVGSDQRAGDFQPRFSPDGTSLAWVGVGLNGRNALFRALLADGRAHQVGGELANLQGLAFSADGQDLIYSASPAGTFNLWRIAVDSGRDAAPQWLPTSGEFAWNPGVARSSGELVFEQVRVDQDIWKIHILEDDPWQMETSPFVQSTRWEYEADFSADGTQVVFISARSGSPELWLAQADGANLRKLTSLGSAGLTNPRWSPDGKMLAFNALQQGRSVIMMVAARGGQPRVLTPDGAGEMFCSWSHDGNSLLFGGNQDNGWEIVRRSFKDGKTEPVLANGAITAVESGDGGILYFTRQNRPGLWSLPLDDNGQSGAGEIPQLILEDLKSQDRHNWALRQGKIYWVFRTGGTAMLAITDLATSHSSLLTELPGMTGNGLSVSPDGSMILYSRTGPMDGDLMVLQRQNKE